MWAAVRGWVAPAKVPALAGQAKLRAQDNSVISSISAAPGAGPRPGTLPAGGSSARRRFLPERPRRRPSWRWRKIAAKCRALGQGKGGQMAANRPNRVENRQQLSQNRQDRRQEIHNEFRDNHPRWDFAMEHPRWAHWRVNRPLSLGHSGTTDWVVRLWRRIVLRLRREHLLSRRRRLFGRPENRNGRAVCRGRRANCHHRSSGEGPQLDAAGRIRHDPGP